MWSLVGIELLKLRKRKKFLITFIAFFILSSLICYGTYRSDKNMRYYSNPDRQIEELNNNIAQMKSDMENTSIPEEARKSFPEQIDNMTKQIAELEKQKNGQAIDWKENIKNTNEDLEKRKETINSQVNDINNDKSMNEREIDSINTEIKKNNYMLEHNIKPEGVGETTAYNTMKNVFEALGAIFLVVIVTVLTSDMISGEYTPATMKVLLTKPVARKKVMFSKFAASIIASVSIAFVVEAIVFIVMGLIFKFGNYNNPISICTKYQFVTSKAIGAMPQLVPAKGATYIAPTFEVYIKALLIQIIFIIAAAAFSFLISTIVKSSMASTSVAVIVVVASSILKEAPFIKNIMPYFFTSYGDGLSIVTGTINLTLNSTFISPLVAIVIMCIWTMLCYVIARIVFDKRDMLI